MRKVIYFMFYTYLLVDAINGLLIRNGFFSVSVIYKFVLLALIVIFLRKYIQIILIIAVMIIYLIIHFFFGEVLIDPLAELDLLIKFFSVFFYYVFFRETLKQGYEKNIFIFSYFAFAILFINLILGWLGMGFAQYEGGDYSSTGTVGFFYAGNELASATIVASSLVLIRAIQHDRYGLFLLVASINIFLAFLSVTKTAMISSIIIALTLPLLKASRSIVSLKVNKNDAYFVLFLFFVIPSCLIFAVGYAISETNIFERWSFFYDKSDDLISFMLSGRNFRVEDALSAFTNHFSAIQVIFGIGNGWSTEIDFFDILMNAGISGVSLTYGFYFFMLHKSIRCIRVNPYSIYSAFIILLLICVSFTAGHTAFSGIAGPLIGALLALANHRSSLLKQSTSRQHINKVILTNG